MKLSTLIWVGLGTAVVGSLIAMGIAYFYVRDSVNKQLQTGATGALTGGLIGLINKQK